MGFNVAQRVAADQPKTREAIGLAALVQFVQAGNFLRLRGYDHFAADLMRQAMGAAKLDHGLRALDTQPCLQRSGFVVNAGVNDAAVVAALVPGHAVFFLQ